MSNYIFMHRSSGEQITIDEVCSEKEARYFLRKNYDPNDKDWIKL